MSGGLSFMLGRVSMVVLVAAEQCGEQFSPLRADYRLEFADYPIKVVRAQRVLIGFLIWPHLFRFCLYVGDFQSLGITPFDYSAGISRLPSGSRAYLGTRRAIVHGSRPRPRPAPIRAGARPVDVDVDERTDDRHAPAASGTANAPQGPPEPRRALEDPNPCGCVWDRVSKASASLLGPFPASRRPVRCRGPATVRRPPGGPQGRRGTLRDVRRLASRVPLCPRKRYAADHATPVELELPLISAGKRRTAHDRTARPERPEQRPRGTKRS
jgi:hypothetical protein